EDDRVVQVDECCAIVELQLRQRQGQAAASQQRRQKPLTSETSQLLDERRQGVIGQVQAAVEIGIVVTPLTLVDPRKPERTVRLGVAGAGVPREASVEDHAGRGG